MNKPETLLVELERSIFTKALVISVVAHVLVLGLTSFSLFADWGKYGVHSPSYINAQKTKENKEIEAANRKKAAEEKAAAEAAKAAAEATNKTAKASAAAKGGTPAVGAGEEKKTPPDVEPLPPKKDFELGDDLSLD